MLPQLFVLERLRRLRAHSPPTPPDASLAQHPALAVPVAAPASAGRRWWRRHFINFVYLVAGIFSAGLGLEAFILPNGLFDGGVTGISLLAARLTNLPQFVSLFLVIFNLPFIWLGYRQLGKGFAIRALAAILGLALVRWDWTPTARGPATLIARATDAKGNTQPAERDPDRRSYMINHYLPRDVVVN